MFSLKPNKVNKGAVSTRPAPLRGNDVRARVADSTSKGETVSERASDAAYQSESNSQTWTTNSGMPLENNTNSLTIGKRGPVLLEDYPLLEKLAVFHREKIPERIVHARGAAAKGYFEVFEDISDLTCAKFLQKGTQTPVAARFSTVLHPRGSPETLRDPRGFAVKFYTDDGNWDLVGNNMPVFFIRDGIQFPDAIRALKPNPKTNIQDWWRIWDYFQHVPESTHMFSWLLDDVGIPLNYRHMPGFGVHTFKLVNADSKETYVKFHWLPKQGEKNIADPNEAIQIGGANHSHATQDLFEAISEGNFPEWEFAIQTMDPATEFDYDFDPLDDTKVWPEEDFPIRTIGRMVLNENPDNFFQENESLAFTVATTVPGVAHSEDKMLQTRIHSYADAQRYRLGTNYMQIPINAPRVPFHNNMHDGQMNMTHRSEEVNYFPSEHDDAKESSAYPQNDAHFEGKRTRERIEKENNFWQAGKRYREFDEDRKGRFVKRVAMMLTQPKVSEQARSTWIGYWTQCDENLGKRVSEAVEGMMA